MKKPDLLRASVLLVSVALGVSACGILPDSKKIDYKSSRAQSSTPSLEVPPDLSQVSKDEKFAVPDVAGKSKATYSAYAADRTTEVQKPQNTAVLPAVDKVKLERQGQERWLVVALPVGQVWDTVKDFWQELGFVIDQEVPEAGIIETDWAENRAKIPDDFIRRSIGKLLDSLYSTGERDKFRTRVEPGSQAGTVEIYISHRGMEEVYSSKDKVETRWQPRASDPDLEVEMLRRLMVRLGTDEKKAEAMVAAAATGADADRAKLLSPLDRQGLEVADRFDRAWRRVGLALDRIGFTVEDRDRAKGIYLIRYVDPDAMNQKPETLGDKLAFWRDKKAPPKTQYRLLLQENNGVSQVFLQTREGQVEQSETTKRILDLLLAQLK